MAAKFSQIVPSITRCGRGKKKAFAMAMMQKVFHRDHAALSVVKLHDVSQSEARRNHTTSRRIPRRLIARCQCGNKLEPITEKQVRDSCGRPSNADAISMRLQHRMG